MCSMHVHVHAWCAYACACVVCMCMSGMHIPQVEIDLAYNEEDVTAPKVRGVRPKKVVQAGRLVGQITFEGTRPVPKYKQLGNIVERIGGVTYLAVKVVSVYLPIPNPYPLPQTQPLPLTPAPHQGGLGVQPQARGRERLLRSLRDDRVGRLRADLKGHLEQSQPELERDALLPLKVRPRPLRPRAEALRLRARLRPRRVGIGPARPVRGAPAQDHLRSARQDRRRGPAQRRLPQGKGAQARAAGAAAA